MNDAGVSTESFCTRESAGWMRCDSASQSSFSAPGLPERTTTSPSTTHGPGSCSLSTATSSGK